MELFRRMFKSANTQNASLTADKERNSWIYGTPLYVKCRSYRLLKTGQVFGSPCNYTGCCQ